MKTYLRFAAGALPALALTLASCTADKIEVPDKELYTRMSHRSVISGNGNYIFV